MMKTLEMVAIVSILFTILGIFIGYQYLKEELDLKFRDVFKVGFSAGIQFGLQIFRRKQ